MSGEESVRRRKPVTKWVVIGALVLAVGLWLAQLLHPALPSSEQASCTVTSPSERHGGYRSRDVFPRIGTDCGSFVAEKEVTCSADPSRTVLLGPGTTYDLIVAGPRIPFLSQPTVLSAQVSKVQAVVPGSRDDDELDDEMPESLRALKESRSPGVLRAFDYEQPAYERRCEPYRMLMTSNGVQMVSPARADELLEVPEGETARDQKLPCDDWYHCEEH